MIDDNLLCFNDHRGSKGWVYPNTSESGSRWVAGCHTASEARVVQQSGGLSRSAHVVLCGDAEVPRFQTLGCSSDRSALARRD